MRICVVDFAGNPGGGVRFTASVLRALASAHPDLHIDLVTFGPALERYRAVFADIGTAPLRLRPVRPVGYWRHSDTRLWGIPGTGWLKRATGLDADWHYTVPPEALTGYDLAWFPWIRQHRFPAQHAVPVVGTLHDTIIFEWPALHSDRVVAQARRAVTEWLVSSAAIVVGSDATRDALVRLFGVAPGRLTVIPPGWDHIAPRDHRPMPPHPAAGPRSYILCAANTSPHKNHEGLFRGLARWGARRPVVLTGYGADLPWAQPRGAELRRLARECGLSIGTSIIPLGYVLDEEYQRLLAHAWALVMPSFMEGGGSFPVMEAITAGIPVISSDIPVMRELLSRIGGEVLWFDPRSPESLARQLSELEQRYDHYRRRAEAQAATVRVPTWEATARAYWGLITA